MNHVLLSCLLVSVVVLQSCYGFLLIDDQITSTSGWPIKSSCNVNNYGTTFCNGASTCAQLGWNGDEGYMQRSIENITQYTEFAFEFSIYLKSFDTSGQPSSDYCYFQYHFDNDGWTTLTTHTLSDLRTTSFPTLVNPGDKTTLHIRFSTSSLEDGENCYISAFKLSVVTAEPTLTPTNNPSISPTNNPTLITSEPTFYPTNVPTAIPTITPTKTPTHNPTITPTNSPTPITTGPSNYPTKPPSIADVRVVESTSKPNKITSDGKTSDENEISFIEKNLFLIIICVSGCIVFCILFLIIGYFKNKKIKSRNNGVNAIELEKVTSLSTIETETNGTLQITEVLSDDNENELKNWLNNIGLIEYSDIFIENGFSDGIDELLDLNNNDLKDMGISKVAHRKRILKQIGNGNSKDNDNIMEGGENNTVGVNTMDYGNDSDNGDELFQTQKILSTKTATPTININKDELEEENLDKMYDSGNKVTKGNK
eukprot:36697_1